MGLSEVLDRVKRAFGPPPPYERPPDLEHTRRLQDRQQTEIDRLRQIVEDETKARDFLRD